jgi:hypothetical protein
MILMLMIVGKVAAEKPQRHHNIKLSFNSGTSFYFADTETPERVREFNSATDVYCGFAPRSLTVSSFFFSSTLDYYVFKNRIGLSTGMILSRMHTNYESNRDFFYWNLASNGTTTDFLRIRNFTQNYYYVGIPFEAKYFERKTERAINLYFKLGYSLNFRLGGNKEIAFYNNEMEKYREAVMGQLPIVNKMFSNLYGGVGLKIGKYRATNSGFPQINIEFRALDLVLTRNFALFVPNPQVTAGTGFQLSVQFPINNNVKIGTR